MYNVDTPVLVFDRPCYTPFSNMLYGYGFDLYEFNYDKPRGLFFSHMAEVAVYAQRIGAVIEMDSRHAPERVTALEYVMSRQDESAYPVPPPDGRHTNKKTPAQIKAAIAAGIGKEYYEAKLKELMNEIPSDADNTEAVGQESYDWTGSSTGYAGGRVKPLLGTDESSVGMGYATSDSVDWFGDD